MSTIDKPRSSLKHAAKRIGVHVSTIHRWRMFGVRGMKLRTVLIGGQRFVFDEDLDAFLQDLNPDQAVSCNDMNDRADAAGKTLDAMGVRSRREEL